MIVQMVAFETLEDEDFTLLTFKVPNFIAKGMEVGGNQEILFPQPMSEDVKEGQNLLFKESEWT